MSTVVDFPKFQRKKFTDPNLQELDNTLYRIFKFPVDQENERISKNNIHRSSNGSSPIAQHARILEVIQSFKPNDMPEELSPLKRKLKHFHFHVMLPLFENKDVDYFRYSALCDGPLADLIVHYLPIDTREMLIHLMSPHSASMALLRGTQSYLGVLKSQTKLFNNQFLESHTQKQELYRALLIGNFWLVRCVIDLGNEYNEANRQWQKIDQKTKGLLLDNEDNLSVEKFNHK